jgi:hypothetical protein
MYYNFDTSKIMIVGMLCPSKDSEPYKDEGQIEIENLTSTTLEISLHMYWDLKFVFTFPVEDDPDPDTLACVIYIVPTANTLHREIYELREYLLDMSKKSNKESLVYTKIFENQPPEKIKALLDEFMDVQISRYEYYKIQYPNRCDTRVDIFLGNDIPKIEMCERCDFNEQ